MRILHVVPSYIPAYRYGGPIYSVHGLCKALATDHDVHVFTTNIDGPNNSSVPLGTPVEIDGVKVWYFSCPFLRRLYWSPSMKKALKKHIPRFDLVHLHSIFLWPTWAAALNARSCGVPYILAPRGMLVKDLIRKKSRWSKTVWIKLFERYNLEQAAAIHVTTTVEKRECERFGFRLPPISIVPNGINVNDFTNNSERISNCIKNLLDKQPMVLFLSRISWKKGLDRLIPALSHVPEAHLVIAGNDEENYTPFLISLANQYGVKQRVTFSGPVRNGDKKALLKAAKVFTLPSHSENFGNVVLEALAVGCPVVVTPQVGLADVVTKCGAGLVVEGEPENIARAIQQILVDSKTRAEMGKNGRKTVKERYTWNSVATQMEQVYQKILVNRRYNLNA